MVEHFKPTNGNLKELNDYIKLEGIEEKDNKFLTLTVFQHKRVHEIESRRFL